MSSQLLHITNGDSFTERLRQLNLKGDIITWREMLCEGKTETNVGSESFWKTRFEFLHKNYNVSKSWFVEKTLKEYRSLCNHKQQDQIVLWFDHDLFCQVNLLAVISWLKSHRRHADISLVSNDPEKEQRSLCEMKDEELQKQFDSRRHLTQDDIEYADYVWQLYCSDNPIRLENLTDYEDYSFKHLSEAVRLHLRRFPSIRNGLNETENYILKRSLLDKPKSKKALIRQLLTEEHSLGFGDSQYERMVARLRPLFDSLNPVKLSPQGKAVLEGKTSYYASLRDTNSYLGGALKYNFLYNTDSGRILKL